jgi:hypothetical protein
MEVDAPPTWHKTVHIVVVLYLDSIPATGSSGHSHALSGAGGGGVRSFGEADSAVEERR